MNYKAFFESLIISTMIGIIVSAILSIQIISGESLTRYSFFIANKLCDASGGTQAITVYAYRADMIQCSDGSVFYAELVSDEPNKFKEPVRAKPKVDDYDAK